jgi:hypothetical protein
MVSHDCSLLQTLLFADDTTTFDSEKDQNVLMEFKKITTFFRAQKMALYPAKTKYILFTKIMKIVLDHNNQHVDDLNLISGINRITKA